VLITVEPDIKLTVTDPPEELFESTPFRLNEKAVLASISVLVKSVIRMVFPLTVQVAFFPKIPAKFPKNPLMPLLAI